MLNPQSLCCLLCCSRWLNNILQPFLEMALQKKLEHLKIYLYPAKRHSHDDTCYEIVTTIQMLYLIWLIKHRPLIGHTSVYCWRCQWSQV